MDMKNSKGKVAVGTGYKDGGMVKKPAGKGKKAGAMKPCAGCPAPNKCAAMGKCLKKGK